MRSRPRLLALVTGLAVMLASLVALPTPASAAPLTKVLVFSKTAGFRHSSIPNGIAAIQQLGSANGFTVTSTEDAARSPPPTWPSTRRWSSCRPPATCSTPASRARSSRTSRGGGGYVGVHAAADTEYGWPWYGTLVGAWFASTRRSRRPP